MSKGIDIGTKTIVVATPSWTTRYRNAVQELDDSNAGNGESSTVRTDSGSYAIGEVGRDKDRPIRSLIGGSDEHGWGQDVITAGIETLLRDSTGHQPGSDFGEDNLIGYVDLDTDVFARLSRAETELDVSFKRVDPGMAVCYDVFGLTPSGLGIMISEGQAFATLAVEGIPVSTACIDYENQWYDVTDSADAVDGEGPRSTWARIRYGTLLGDLVVELAAGSPSLGESTAVAIGGKAAPVAIRERDADAIGEVLQTDIASVTIAETPEESPARGALVAVQESDEHPAPVPAFAATDGYASALADTGAAADAFASGVDRPNWEPGSATPVSNNDAKRTRAQRHRARLASTLDRLVDQMHDDGGTDQLDEFRDEIEAAIADLEADLADVEQQASREEAVTDLKASVTGIEEKVTDLETDIAEVRTATAGLDEDSLDDPDAAEALGSVATDALQDDIDSVEADLASRIGGLWDEIDDINDKLVNLSARVNELPDIEGDLESTDESVERLSGETADIRQSIVALQEDIEAIDQQAATTDEIQSIRSDFDRIVEQLDQLRSEFRNVDRVDPARVDQLQRDLDALRETVLNHARRLEGVERTVSDFDDRIDRAFQDTAKAETLASLQAEVSQIGKNASSAAETANSAAEATDSIGNTVENIQEEMDQLRKMVDSLAESTVTRSEMDDSLVDLEDRIANIEAEKQMFREQLSKQGVASTFTLQLIAAGLASVGGLGALLAFALGRTAFTVGFLVLVTGPAVWLWLSVEDL